MSDGRLFVGVDVGTSGCRGCARLRYVQHQAGWIMGRLLGHFGLSDENNCLKLGYDARVRRWPNWLNALDIDTRLLPEVYPARALY